MPLITQDGHEVVYSLLRVPKVDGYLGVRHADGQSFVALIPAAFFEEATRNTSQKTNGSSSLDGIMEHPVTSSEDVLRIVYEARGYHPPEKIPFNDHPFPSTLDSDLSGM